MTILWEGVRTELGASEATKRVPEAVERAIEPVRRA